MLYKLASAFGFTALFMFANVTYATEVSSEVGNSGNSEIMFELAADMSKPLEYFHYVTPDNVEYGVLRTIIEEQGHQQLKLGNWLPGENDLTREQIKSLDFSKLDLSNFLAYIEQPTGGPNMILMKVRENQVIKEKKMNDQLVRTLPHEGPFRPASDIALSQDDINLLVAETRFSWWLDGTSENHAKYISALGMAAARRDDIFNAKFMAASEIATGEIK